MGYDKRAVQARAGHLERVVGARYTDNTRARDRATRHRRRSPFVSGISFRDIEMQVLATGRVCMRYEMKSVPFVSTMSTYVYPSAPSYGADATGKRACGEMSTSASAAKYE